MIDVPSFAVPTVAVVGETIRFPVRRIYCVGRNYAEHAREMGSDPEREAPFFFSKPADAVVADDSSIAYPSCTAEFHHEVELVVAIGRGGSAIPVEAALDHVFGYAVGIDLTRRDLQAAAKQAGRPWDMAKGFDASAPCAAITRGQAVPSGAIWLTVNGATRQAGTIADLIWSVPEVIAQLSTLVALQGGDLIYTGTPAGVAALVPGDAVVGHVDGLADIRVRIAG